MIPWGRWLLVALVCVAGCEQDSGGACPPCPVREGVVSRVIDGDTLQISIVCTEDSDCPTEDDSPGACLADGRCDRDSTVRLVGVNTGEIPHGFPDDPDPECLGDEARQALEDLVLSQTVRLVYEPVAGCRDIYGRLLAYVFLGDELVQSRLLREGLACVYWASSRPEKHLARYVDELNAAETVAYDGQLGVWTPRDASCGGLKNYTGRCDR